MDEIVKNGSIMIGLIEYKLSRGEWISNEPFGYTRDYENRKGRHALPIIPHEEDAEVVNTIFNLFVSDKYSLRSMVEVVAAETPYKLNIAQIECILKDKFYIGIMTHGGKEYEHHYIRILDEELFNRVQKLIANKGLTGRTVRRIAQYKYLYNGFIKCGMCGRAATGQVVRSQWKYYNCTSNRNSLHKIKRINEKHIDLQVNKTIYKIEEGFYIKKIYEDSTFEDKQKLLKYLFSSMILNEVGDLIIKLNENVNLDCVRQITDKNTVQDDDIQSIILKLCMYPTALDLISSKTHKPILELQPILFDLQMNDRIEEVEMGIWKTK